MEEKGNAELDKVTSRRSRKDEEGRDFMCGCGKRYLSYPALYTHIKTKHDGRQPEGTLKSGSLKRHKPRFQEETLRSIYTLLHREDLRLLAQLGDSATGRVPLTFRIKKELVAKQIYDSYLWLMRQSEVKLHHTSSLDLVLTVYLLNAGQHVNDKIYEQFLLFARIARGCFYEHGDEVHKVYFSKGGPGPFQLATFNPLEVKYFPIICDFAVQCYIPVTHAEGKDVNASLMELMLFDFCSWLYLRKLTPIRTSFAKDFKLDYKPPPSKNRHAKPDHKEANDIKEEEEDSEDSGSEMEEMQDEGAAVEAEGKASKDRLP